MKTSFRNKKLTVITLFIIVFIAIQFFGQDIKNPPVTGEIKAPKEVKQILERSCYSCHSNETQLQWFDKIAPGSWLVQSHVKNARMGMNFSEWDKMTEIEKKGKLWELFNFVADGDMPKKSYVALHPNAKVEKKDIDILRNYVLSLTSSKINDTAKINSFNRQYSELIKQNKSKAIPTAPNGIPFIEDYKNWQIISTSERFDSGTMRIIYGNPTAIKAVHDNKTNPWPDGAVLAKVVWTQLKNEYGEIKPGEYKYIQYMIKDNRKYAKTKGWGFARFDNLDNKPFGKENFEYSCINCHRVTSDQDYVFTRPIKQ